MKTATISRRVATIGTVHRKAGHYAPTDDEGFKATLAGIRREKGGDRTPKTPLLVEDVHRIGYILAGTDSLRDKRDLALVTVGFAGAFRQSELVALDIEDIEEVPGGLRVRIRRSKTDQEGEGDLAGIPRSRVKESCPVRVLLHYLSAAGIDSGPVFRRFRKGDNILTERLKAEAVSTTVKRLVELIGKEPQGYGGHSLRAGLATCAAMNGATLSEIAKQGRWKSSDTILNHYIRPANLLTERNAATVARL